MGYRIRIAIPQDEQRIRELFTEMLQTIYHTEDVKGYESGYLNRYWTNGEERILVAEDESVVAFLSIEVHHEPEADYAYLDDLSVTERYRNIGTVPVTSRPRDCPDRYYIISASAPDHISPSAEYQTHQISPPLSLLPLRPYWTKMPPAHLWRRGSQYYY